MTRRSVGSGEAAFGGEPSAVLDVRCGGCGRSVRALSVDTDDAAGSLAWPPACPVCGPLSPPDATTLDGVLRRVVRRGKARLRLRLDVPH